MSLIRRISHYARPYKWHLLAGILCAGGVSAMTAATAQLVGGPLIDRIFREGDEWWLAVLPFLLVGVHLLKGICRYGQAMFVGYAGQSAVHDLRDSLYTHVIRMPTSFFSERSTGDLLSRVIADCGAVQNGFTLVIKNVLQNSLTAVFLIIQIFVLSPMLAPIALLGLPLVIVPIMRLGQRLRKVAGESQRGLGELSSHVQETVTGVRVVKAYAMEDVESSRFRTKSRRQLGLIMRGVRLGELSAPLMETVSAVGLAVIIWVGGREVLNGDMSAGDLTTILASLGLMYVPIKALTRAYNDLNRSLGAAERIFELFDLSNEGVHDQGRIEAPAIQHELRLESVSFTYPGRSERPAVHDIDLCIKRGEALALVGRSGSGKSTIANLILRFYDPTSGWITLDGVDLRELTMRSLRRQIGMVSQDVILFDGTVRENILYGSEGATEADLMAAARAAHAVEFVEELPDGFDTHIGEKGVRLSGGQKQRLSIARTLLSNPPILILDEATSALDSRSEGIVQEAIESLMRGRTTVVIAHRLSTIQNADRVVVMDEGRIVEQGTLDELVALEGHYVELARGGFERTGQPREKAS